GDSMLTGNTATGFNNAGVHFAGAGGGLFNSSFSSYAATLTVTGCTLSGNSADKGGGIFNQSVFGFASTVEITGSTLCGNSAGEGGGIFNTSFIGLPATVPA